MGIADYGSVSSLLGEMDAVKRRLQGGLTQNNPDAFNVAAPPQGAPMAPPPLMAPAPPTNALPVGNPATNLHEHQKGIRGGLLHALGADRISPELGALLTPDQQQRVKPGLTKSLLGLLAGVTPSQQAMGNAASMIALQDNAAKRNDAATLKGQMDALRQKYANGGGSFAEFAQELAMIRPELSAPLAGMVNALTPAAPQRPSGVTWRDNVSDKGDGKVYQVAYDANGKEVARVEQYVKPDAGLTEYQRLSLALQRDRLNKPQGGGKLPTSAIEKMIDLDAVTSLAQNAKSSLESAVAAGKDVSGRIGGIVPVPSWIRNQVGQGGEQGQSARNLLGDLTSQVGKMRSGGAITPQEFNRLEAFLPNQNDNENVISIKLKNFIKTLEDIKRIRIANYAKYGGVGSSPNEMPQEDRPTLVWPEG